MPFDVEALANICKRNNLFLIEDAAQAQGARYKGQVVGGFGEMACFSFYPGKNLGACGEAGGITTNSPDYYTHLQSLRNHGSKIRYYHDEIGFNMRMGGLEAASLSVKLKYLNEWNERRAVIAARYKNEIKNDRIRMQRHPDEVSSVYHLFVVQVDDRERFVQYMNEWNIFPAFHYPVPCHLQKAYAHLGYSKGHCPNAEMLAAHCVSLPIYSELPNDAVSYVIDLINQY
jgi:dTDP-4-amino-4,6-dideoxygalactose transaminase